MTLRSMATTQATTATTLNSSPERKQAAGRNTKWKWKLAEPMPTPLRNAGVESCRASKETINRTDSFRNGEVGRGTRTLRRAKDRPPVLSSGHLSWHFVLHGHRLARFFLSTGNAVARFSLLLREQVSNGRDR